MPTGDGSRGPAGADASPVWLRRASEVAWRALIVAAAVVAAIALLARLRLVVLPLFVAALLATALVPLARALERRGWAPLIATAAPFGGSIVILILLGVLIVPAVVDEFSELGPVISEAVDDIERWFVEGPIGLERDQLRRYRREAGDSLGMFLRSSSGGVVSGAFALAEALAGSVLAVVLTFFLVKDGPRFQRWTLDHLPAAHHDVVRACAGRAWDALGGFLRGAAALGVVEAVIIGVTLLIVGSELVIPVMVLTFLAAFFPIVGAVAAGVVATLVALVSGGLGDALVVAVVSLVVQQFDSDLLAPVIYGKLIQLHPAVVLLALAAGGTLGGIAGAFLAVPVAAVITAVGSELWGRRHDSAGQPASSDHAATRSSGHGGP